MEKLDIGKIAKPQGIKGELKIIPLTDNIERFLDLKEIYIDKEIEKRKIRGCRINQNNVYMYIDGIISRNDAEKYRGVYLSIDKKDAISLNQNQFFIVDIIGCKMYNEKGEYLGQVKNIMQNGAAADVFEVKGEKNFMIPFVNGLTETVDIEHKKIIVKGKRFLEVVCYEN